MRSRVVVLAVLLGACARSGPVRSERVGEGDAAATPVAVVSAAPSTSLLVPDASGANHGACVADPPGGLVIADSSRAVQVAIAAAGTKALVTFWDSKKQTEGPGIDTAVAHVFDASNASLGPRQKLEVNDVGDMPVSTAAPVVLSGDLQSISCAWAAPMGKYACRRTKVGGGAPATLFAFSGIASGGPEKPDLAAVAKGEDTLVVVPVASDLQLFSTRVSAKKKDSPFTYRVDDSRVAPPDALTAVLSGDDEATVVYRRNGGTTSIEARRAGFDQKWHGAAIALSAKGTQVGAPAIATDGDKVVALFSQRATTSELWKVFVVELAAKGVDVKRSELAIGSAEQAQGPGIARAADAGCFHVSWVEGSGKTTRTKLARMCNGALVAGSTTTLSSDGIEGGRAYLASDPANPSAVFAVWQEIRPRNAAELRVARLDCK